MATKMQRIKGYELQDRIGAGGFGAVYRAYQSTVGREVAIKIILPGLASQPEFIRRFEGEAQLVARLEHPHITPLYDYWRDPDGAYLVMRWLRGGSLHDALQNGPFELHAAALMLDQISGALSLAHRNGIIHRDIKPGNILLDEDGNAYLTDFGIAKDLNLPGSHTGQDVIVGSLDYISPEQARSEMVTPRTDIYSLGVTLYEVIVGHHPFENLSPIERLYKHINDPLPEIASLEPSIQVEVNRVIQKATAKNPEQRYPDALAFGADFRQAIGLNRTSTTLVELLTQREQDILRLIIDGLSNKEIAQELSITLSTVKWYVNQIYSKMGVRSRVQAIVRARELDLINRFDGEPSAVIVPTEDFHPENPYKGLRAFQAADNQDFFGREKVTSRLISRMSESTDYSRFLAVIGPSGSGKSSLVKAGLIPALWRGELSGSDKWFIVEMLPGSHPLDELEVALTRIAANQSNNLNEHLRRDNRGLQRVAGLLLPNDGSELVLVIDQFEEVFTLLDDETERSHFLELLYTAVTEQRSRVRVIITLRADFYDRPLHYSHFGELIRNRLETIMPLSAEELESAIREPASRTGVTFEPGLVSAIIADVNYQPGALPLLQYALTELFEQRQGRLLTREAYYTIGKTVGALAKRAEEIYLSLNAVGQEAVHQLFLRLITPGEGTEDTRRRVTRSELLAIANEPDVMDEVIDAYTEYRLLSLDTDPGTRSPTVEVAHEALLREWERLRQWLNESREDIKTQLQIAALASEWQNAQQDTSFLARGSRLTQLETWAKDTRLALTAAERAYLDASLNQRAAELQIESQRQEREQRLEKRSQNFLRGLVAVFAIATLIAIGLSIFAFKQSQVARDERDTAQIERQRAETQARIAQSRELVGYVRDTLESDGELSTLLALQAVNVTNAADGTVLPEAEAVLHQAVQGLHTPLRLTAEIGDSGSWGYGFSPDGMRLAYTLNLGAYEKEPAVTGIADAVTGKLLYQLPGGIASTYIPLSNHVITVTFAADRQFELQFWDISSNDHATHLASATVPIVLDDTWWQDVSPDFHYFVASMLEGPPRIWDLTTNTEIVTPVTRNLPEGNIKPTFSPDGTRLGIVNPDGTLSILDTTTWEELIRLSPPNTTITGDSVFRFSLNGERIAIANTDGTVTLWGVATGVAIYTFHPPITATSSLALNADGTWIAVATSSGQVTIWNSTTQREGLALGVADKVSGITLSPDGTRLATYHMTGQVQIWDLVPGREALTLVNHDSDEELSAVGLAYSPDGQRLIATGTSTTPNVWDVQTGQKLLALTGHTGRVMTTAWSPDGMTLATAGEDHKAILWDAATGAIRLTLTGHTDTIFSIAFSPDSSRLATSSYDGSLRIWDVQTGELGLTLTQEGIEDRRGVAWSPDGLHIANLAQDFDEQLGVHLYILNALTGEIEHDTALGDIGNVRGLMYSPDGTRIAAVMAQSQYYLVFDAQTGEKMLTLPGHGVFTSAIAFSPDGSLIATGGWDNMAQLWDANTGEELLKLFTPSGWSYRLAFSPDGSHLAIQDQNSTTWIYVLQLEDLIALAESRLTRWWTVDECRQYLHTDTCPPDERP